nr:beta-1,3-galactosyltransferase brn-like isoform X1 [Ciona intestinalis]XP_018672691.1 beta-1,3-galactosyltransferase brn-like isoform X1 [Ciona intestinalis]XP_026695955.1 beta-1,3-galactosyltransferase brn-like isoform X1 [Ciona intestinalis]|eukprot:XP_002130357.1 beta-1,3-galactosyltransferase brn-like isoform X1 [Ciona intestinalis]
MKVGRIDILLMLAVSSVASLFCSFYFYKQTKDIKRNLRLQHPISTTEAGFQLKPTTAKPMFEQFTYIYEPRKLLLDICHKDNCTTSKEHKWRMLMFVKSSAGNTRRRELLRKTWASLSRVCGGWFDTVFVVGATTVGKLRQFIHEEHERYGDILQYNGSDAYRDIAAKTLAGMHWASKYLNRTDFYSSVDDDFMIDMTNLHRTVEYYINKTITKDWPEFPIICGFILGQSELPIRNTRSKWRMEKNKYKWPSYPPYCHGGLYTTSVNVIQQLYKESQTMELFTLDDVWITGILRRRIGMPDEMVLRPERYYGSHEPGADEKTKIDDFYKMLSILGTENTCRCFADEIVG